MFNFRLCLEISTRFYYKLPKPVAPQRGSCCSSRASGPARSDTEHMLPVSTRVHTQTCVHSLEITPSKADRNTQTEHKWPNPALFSVLSCAVPQRFAPVGSWFCPSPWGWCSPGTALEKLGQSFVSLTEAPLMSLCSSVWVWAFHHRTEQVISGNRNGTETLEITQDLSMFRNVWVT